MEHKITATELARSLGDVLGRVRYRHESFLVERNGAPVARVVPIGSAGDQATLSEALAAWSAAAAVDTSLADDLERVGQADQTPANPWAR